MKYVQYLSFVTFWKTELALLYFWDSREVRFNQEFARQDP